MAGNRICGNYYLERAGILLHRIVGRHQDRIYNGGHRYQHLPIHRMDSYPNNGNDGIYRNPDLLYNYLECNLYYCYYCGHGNSNLPDYGLEHHPDGNYHSADGNPDGRNHDMECYLHLYHNSSDSNPDLPDHRMEYDKNSHYHGTECHQNCIYRLFLQGLTPFGIAKQLTAEGIPTPAKKEKWNAATVRRILENEKYKGDALLQKSYTVDFLTKKTKINEGEIPQYYVENNHEPIIDPAVFDEVQLELQRRCPGRNRHSGVHDFSGKIKCGECGSWYGSKVWHSNDKYRRTVWQCNHKFDGGQKCTTPHLDEETIKNAFIRAANKALQGKDAAIAAFEAAKGITFDTSSLEAEQEQLMEEIKVVSEMIEKSIYENARVAQNQDEYKKRYEGLTARYDKAKSRLDAVTAEIQDKTSRCQAIEYYMKLLREQDTVITAYSRDCWHRMVDFVTVYSKEDIRFTFKDGTEIQA